ncbi:NUMOD4 domain-containing protein, partial [Dyadobacter sp. CY327]|uniref:NUMOD4 domain-containing protein n=1 Tax=Dyadobacter sp. CY327 TaxID=2907301 RepID=UPI001F2E73D5
MTEEIWKPVVGYEEFYLVSNTGKIKSLRKDRLLACCPDGWGYPAVILHRDSVGVKTKVHRIMMAAFVAPSKLQVNH